MMTPKTISERMQYCTVRLVTNNGSTGTGFFFKFNFEGGKSVPIIVTNKHVVNHNEDEPVTFYLHTQKDGSVLNENPSIAIKTKWFFHPDKDLCFSYAGPIFNEMKDVHKKDVFYIDIAEDKIWDNVQLEDLSAIEDVIMVGYPIGLWDQKNNLPLFRKGITATHPSIDFNEKNIGIVDMACFPGSSGSPIFVCNENGFTDKKGNISVGGKRLIFLGILFQGPVFNSYGNMVVETIPTGKVTPVTPVMINLGYYIKAVEVLEFKKVIEKHVEKL
jgi:hypothetical protein